MSKSREAFLWMVGLSLVTLVLGLLYTLQTAPAHGAERYGSVQTASFVLMQLCAEREFVLALRQHAAGERAGRPEHGARGERGLLDHAAALDLLERRRRPRRLVQFVVHRTERQIGRGQLEQFALLDRGHRLDHGHRRERHRRREAPLILHRADTVARAPVDPRRHRLRPRPHAPARRLDHAQGRQLVALDPQPEQRTSLRVVEDAEPGRLRHPGRGHAADLAEQ